MQIFLNSALKSCLLFKCESTLLLQLSSILVQITYVAASVNTDYSEALIVLKFVSKVYLHFLHMNDVTIHCGFFSIPLQQCTFWCQFSSIIFQEAYTMG